MNTKIAIAVLAGAVIVGGLWVFNGKPAPTQRPVAVAAPAQGDPIVTGIKIPASFTETEQLGKAGFNAICAACHGENGGGREGMGPPFMSPIYRPGHHGDMAFQMAVQNGVRSHHWKFGNMPPQKGLTRSDVSNIVAYVRALQRENGIE